MTYPCPCCGCLTMAFPDHSESDICEVCGWQDDPLGLEDPDRAVGPNPVSLKEARVNYREFGASAPRRVGSVRPARPDEIPPGHTEDEAGLVQGDNFIIMRDRTDWFSAYTKRIDAGVMEPEQPGVTYPCPCCGYPTLPERGGYSICFLCYWEDDGQDDPSADEVWGGPNGSYSLTQARSNFAEFGIMYSPGDHGTPEAEPVRQAKRAVCAAYEAVRSAGPDASPELLERLEKARRRLEEERRRDPPCS